MTDPSASDSAALRREFAAFRDVFAGGSQCPSGEQVWDAACGRLDVVRRREVVDHVAVCGACAEEWRLAVALQAELGQGQEGVVWARQPRPATWRRWRGLAMAVAASLLLVVGMWRGSPWHEPVPVYRAGGGPVVQSALPVGVLARGECRPRWFLEPQVPGARFHLTVMTRDLEPVVEVADLDAGEYLLPETSLARLPVGSVLLWQVEAVLPDGTRVRSATFELRCDGSDFGVRGSGGG